MDDLVKSLRKGDTYGDCKHDRCMCVVMEDAANEIERLREVFKTQVDVHVNHIKGLKKQQEEELEIYRKEIERLREYRSVVHFIANDYYELSYDKIKWQRDDWRKRCQKVIEENYSRKET